MKMEEQQFSSDIYRSFPGQDRFQYPEYLKRVTAGFGGETILIFGSDKTALYDCGMAYCYPDTILNIQSALKERGHEELDYILLSHTHYDHIGALPYILAAYPDVAVCGAKKAASVFQSSGARKTMERLGRQAQKNFNGNPEIDITAGNMRVDVILDEGDVLDLGNFKINVLVTKGHTDCSLTFVISPVGLMLLSESTGVLRNPNMIHTAFVKNYKESIASAKKCRNYGADQLLIPHFGMAPKGYIDDYFNWYIKEASAEKDFILGEAAKTNDYDRIYKAYEDKYWNEQRGRAQPYAAFVENSKHTIANVLRLYGIL